MKQGQCGVIFLIQTFGGNKSFIVAAHRADPQFVDQCVGRAVSGVHRTKLDGEGQRFHFQRTVVGVFSTAQAAIGGQSPVDIQCHRGLAAVVQFPLHGDMMPLAGLPSAMPASTVRDS